MRLRVGRMVFMASPGPWSYRNVGYEKYVILDANGAEVAIVIRRSDAATIVALINEPISTLQAQFDAAVALLRRQRTSASKSWGEAEKLAADADAFLRALDSRKGGGT